MINNFIHYINTIDLKFTQVKKQHPFYAVFSGQLGQVGIKCP